MASVSLQTLVPACLHIRLISVGQDGSPQAPRNPVPSLTWCLSDPVISCGFCNSRQGCPWGPQSCWSPCQPRSVAAASAASAALTSVPSSPGGSFWNVSRKSEHPGIPTTAFPGCRHSLKYLFLITDVGFYQNLRLSLWP